MAPPRRKARTPAIPSLEDRGVFVREDAPTVEIGARTFTRVTNTVGSIKRLEAFLRDGTKDGYPADAMAGYLDTVGDMMVEGAIQGDNYAPLLRFLSTWVVTPEVVVDDIYQCDPGVLTTLITDFFESSGLRWMERIIKNSPAVKLRTDNLTAAEQVARAIARNIGVPVSARIGTVES